MQPWWYHVVGALEILKTHNPWRLEDQNWIKMFSMLRNLVMIGCILRFEAVPDVIVSLSEAIANFPQQPLPALPNPDNYLFFILTRLCNLRAKILDKSIAETSQIISEAKQIDADLVVWLQYLPPEFFYTNSFVLDRARRDDFFHEYFHVYPDFLVATQWNLYRTGRLIANALILRHMPCDPYSLLTRQKLQSCQHQMAEDICASVPYLLDVEIIQKEPHAKPRAAGGSLLLCPLIVVATLTDSEPVREFVLQRLKYIGLECGVRRAYIQYEALSSRKQPGWHCPLWV